MKKAKTGVGVIALSLALPIGMGPVGAKATSIMSTAGLKTDISTIDPTKVNGTGTVEASGELTTPPVDGQPTTVPENTKTSPTVLTFVVKPRIGRQHMYSYGGVTFGTTKKGKDPASAGMNIHNTLTEKASYENPAPIMPVTSKAQGTQDNISRYDGNGNLTQVVLDSIANVAVAAGQSGHAAAIGSDPLTVGPQTTPFLFNPTITLGLSYSSGLGPVGVFFSAYSGPTTSNLSLLFNLAFSFSSTGQFTQYFYGSSQLGFNTQDQMDRFLMWLVSKNLNVNSESVSLKNQDGFSLFASAIPLDISTETVFAFEEGAVAGLPTPLPPTLPLLAIGLVAIGLLVRRSGSRST